ncbi:uncharacterized protein LOC134217320 [Armigeres subalbatus]|uniref:uncharacterized protein LOC134217320 n=1 Tax=Armigeres subalbatus TaxID=124917 RepID=UPI002ECFF293
MGRNWRNDLQDFLHSYRATPHSITRHSPSELLFGWNIRDKLPGNSKPVDISEARHNDEKFKEKGRVYANLKRNAKPNNIDVGDYVIVKNFIKKNKLTTTFNPDQYLVIQRKGTRLQLKNIKSGVICNRHVNHTKRILNANPMLAIGSDSENYFTIPGGTEEIDSTNLADSSYNNCNQTMQQASTNQPSMTAEQTVPIKDGKRSGGPLRATSKRPKHLPVYLSEYKL